MKLALLIIFLYLISIIYSSGVIKSSKFNNRYSAINERIGYQVEKQFYQYTAYLSSPLELLSFKTNFCDSKLFISKF